MKNLLLFLIAITLFILFLPFAVVFIALDAIFTVFGDLAISIDMAGNVLLRRPMNLWLKKDNGYKFGNTKDTISYVLGKNEESKTLTQFGRSVCWLLNLLEKDHCKKAVEKSDGNKI